MQDREREIRQQHFERHLGRNLQRCVACEQRSHPASTQLVRQRDDATAQRRRLEKKRAVRLEHSPDEARRDDEQNRSRVGACKRDDVVPNPDLSPVSGI